MDQTGTSEITHTRSSKEYHKSVNSSFGQILPHLDTLQEGSSVLWRRRKRYRSNLCNNNMSNVLYDSCMFPISSLTDGSHSCYGFYSPQLNNSLKYLKASFMFNSTAQCAASERVCTNTLSMICCFEGSLWSLPLCDHTTTNWFPVNPTDESLACSRFTFLTFCSHTFETIFHYCAHFYGACKAVLYGNSAVNSIPTP